MNNPSEADTASLEKLGGDRDQVKYLIYGQETAPTTGCVHYQGYVVFTNGKSLKAAKKKISPRCHLEVSKGSAEQNRKYCSKDGIIKEFGDLPQQGKRSDLVAVQDAIKKGATEKEIAETHFGTWVKYRKSLQAYRELIHTRPSISKWKLTDFPGEWLSAGNGLREYSLIFWGLPGIGKTEFAKACMPGALLVSHVDDLLLYDPNEYSGIIFDDMSFTHMPRSAQIHIVDSDNGRSIHCRYRTAWIPPNTQKIFTTNEHEGRIFDLDDGAIRRRVKVSHLMKNL